MYERKPVELSVPAKVGLKCHHRKQTEGKSCPEAYSPGYSAFTQTSTFLTAPQHPRERNFHVLSGRPSKQSSKPPTRCADSYGLLPPAPASAAAFRAEIGIRPFSQNTKHKAALCKLGRSRFLSARPARCTHLHTNPRELPQPLVLKPFLRSPTRQKARGTNSGRRWGQTASSPQGSPLSGPRTRVRGEESYRVAGVSAPLPAPGRALRRGPRGSAAPSRGAGPERQRGGPPRAPAGRPPEVCELTPARRPAGRAPRSCHPGRRGGRARSAAAVKRPERRNRCPAPLAEPPGPQADSTRPAALNGAFRRKGEAAEGGGRGPRAARGCGGT